MDDIGVIDRFLDTFSRYIDSGFGLLGGDIAFLTAALIVIDITLAGLFWAMGGDDVMGKLIKKTLYVGAFAFIITHFNALASIVFRSFAGLGLIATGSTLTQQELLQPGRIAAVGVETGWTLIDQVGQLGGFPGAFYNLETILVLFFAWLVVIFSFFTISIQLFVTLIEFKLTTLAGFVLVPFALWNKTAFLAERVLGNVMASGVKVLVLAVIVGIGTQIFGEFQTPPGSEPSLDQAMALMLAAMTLLGLAIFGPGIATGLVSGAPQLGAGAAAGTALGATGIGLAAGATVAAGARMVPTLARGAARGARSGGAAARGAGRAFREGAAGKRGMRAAGGGLAQMARQGAGAIRRRVGGAEADRSRKTAGSVAGSSAGAAGQAAAGAHAAPPAWAERLQRRQHLSHGVGTTAHVLRSSDSGGGGGAGPHLRDDSEK